MARNLLPARSINDRDMRGERQHLGGYMAGGSFLQAAVARALAKRRMKQLGHQKVFTTVPPARWREIMRRG